MSTTIDPANKPADLTLLGVLRDASPLPWLLTGEQHEDRSEQYGWPIAPWHVPGNWPYAVIHQFHPSTYHMGRGDGYSIADGMQDKNNARLMRAAREMAEAISYALTCLDATISTPCPLADILRNMHAAAERLHEAERAIIGPLPMAKPVA